MPSLNLLRPRGRHHSRTVTEAAPPIKAQLPASRVQRQGFVYGVPPGGMDENQAALGASTQTDRKGLLNELYEAYLSCPWAWASVQAIARTITAGGLVTDWATDDSEGDQKAPAKPENVAALEALVTFCNPQQNIRQLLRNWIADAQVFGDGLLEVVWYGSRPVALYNLDSPTTTPVCDEHGTVTGYVQVADSGQTARFDPREIIRISLDAARPGVTGVSPMQAALGPVTAWLFAQGCAKEEFKKGLPPNIHADFPSATPDKDIRTWKDQYASRNVGARNIGAPIVTKGGAKLAELQTGKISDVINGKNQARDEILSIFGCPPSQAGVIESGNLGGGTGESQFRNFQELTCGPIEELAAEALNYSLTQQAFKITDWLLKFGEVDWRDSAVIEGIRDQRLRNGSITLNKYRAEIGEPPVAGGDDAVLVDRQNLVLWSDMAAMSKAMVASKGAPAAAAGEEPPNDEPLQSGGQPPPGGVPDDDDKDDDEPPPGPGGKPPAKETALRVEQYARYQARLSEALKQMPATEPAAIAAQVRAQLGENFPPAATAWADDAEWSGPHPVPVEQIDTANRDQWAASSDGSVGKFRAKLRAKLAAGGHPKPAVLVRVAGSDKDEVADGHHRVLAAVDEGEPTVWAYVGRVASADDNAWREMHSSQQQ